MSRLITSHQPHFKLDLLLNESSENDSNRNESKTHPAMVSVAGISHKHEAVIPGTPSIAQRLEHSRKHSERWITDYMGQVHSKNGLSQAFVFGHKEIANETTPFDILDEN